MLILAHDVGNSYTTIRLLGDAAAAAIGGAGACVSPPIARHEPSIVKFHDGGGMLIARTEKAPVDGERRGIGTQASLAVMERIAVGHLEPVVVGLAVDQAARHRVDPPYVREVRRLLKLELPLVVQRRRIARHERADHKPRRNLDVMRPPKHKRGPLQLEEMCRRHLDEMRCDGHDVSAS
jgi:hypothetical protein